MQVYFQSLHWSYLPRVLIILITSVYSNPFTALNCFYGMGFQQRDRKISYFIKNILMCSLKINESLVYLERHLLMQWCGLKGSHWCVWWLRLHHKAPVRKPCSDKPVSRHVEHVQLCSLREFRRDAHQTVLSHTQDIQTAAAADLRQITKTTWANSPVTTAKRSGNQHFTPSQESTTYEY